MRAPGPLLAAGRDSDIFEYGPGLVLRRSREGHSMRGEARVMEYVRGQGYPVPAIDEISDDGLDIVMERVEGLDMVAMMTKRPWTIPRQGRALAELHVRLHEISAPDWLRAAPVGRGDRVVHLDLHPLNVIIGPRGPVVIDWSNASRGDPVTDVTLAWVLMSAGSAPTGRLIGALLGRARSVLVENFLGSFDIDELRRSLRDVVAWKVGDPHMSADEQARMWRLVRAAGRGEA
jgi:aminoglycoside phosphotransferase (APT) family kinase protein